MVVLSLPATQRGSRRIVASLAHVSAWSLRWPQATSDQPVLYVLIDRSSIQVTMSAFYLPVLYVQFDRCSILPLMIASDRPFLHVQFDRSSMQAQLLITSNNR